MTIEVIEAIGFDVWASYLINGDASGIDDADIAQADAFAEYLGGHIASCSDESIFTRPDFPRNALAGNCVTYYSHIAKG